MNLREHSRLLAGAIAGLIVALALTLPGCGTTADPMGGSKKINATQLSEEAATQQSVFDKQAQAVTQEQNNALADYATDAATLKAKYARTAAQIATDTAAYNADLASFNGKLDAAQADLQKQAQMRASIVNTAGGIIRAAAGAGFDPSAAIGTALTAVMGLGLVGSLADSASKSKILAIKNQKINQLTAGGPASPAAPQSASDGGATGLVQPAAPSIVAAAVSSGGDAPKLAA